MSSSQPIPIVRTSAVLHGSSVPDKATDLAVIKIDTNSPLPTVKMGNSDTAQVGDWVEAIGSPFALAQTVTAGIISAKNRTIEPGVERTISALHSDRCRDQPRQLRWATV